MSFTRAAAPHHLEWSGPDGRADYPLQGVDQAITYAYTPRAGGVRRRRQDRRTRRGAIPA
jgi:hypothetical protein